MIYTFDTEFHEHQSPHGQVVEPISLGIVSYDQRTLYLEFNDFDIDAAEKHPFLLREVLPKLGPPEKRVSRAEGAKLLTDFVGTDNHPEFWAYYADYDWVVFCCLFGGMTTLQRGWPMLCMDLKQELLRRSYTSEEIPKQDSHAHHALADALWNMRVIKWLEGRDKLRSQQNQKG